MDTPRLFQLIDSETQENIGLYLIVRESLSDEQVEQLIKQNYQKEMCDELLEDNGIIRVFVTEIYS